jgi:hypothetical protein
MLTVFFGYKEEIDKGLLSKKDEDYLKNTLMNYHVHLEEILNKFVEIFKVENVKGILPTLIKELKKESNFDWSIFKEFELFINGKYVKILKRLEELK